MSETIPSIRRTGLIFRQGEYGAKGIYTAADIDAMAGDEPLPVNLEHRKSLLDSRLGQCVRRFSAFDDKGERVLMGEWDEPAPLAALLGDTPRRASIEIDLKTKKPVGLALTHIPHIQDAVLFSEAVEEAYAKFSRGEEIEPLETVPQEKPMSTEATATPVVVADVETKPSFMDSLRALFSGAQPHELDAAETALTTAKTGKTPREIELEAKVAAFEAEKANAQFSSIENAASAQADKLVTSGHIKAKGNDDYEKAIAAFSAAALADRASDEKAKIACFAADSATAKFSMSEHLASLYAKTPKHDGSEKTKDLTPDQIAVFDQDVTTVTDPATGKPTDINALLNLTPMGEAMLREQNKTATAK